MRSITLASVGLALTLTATATAQRGGGGGGLGGGGLGGGGQGGVVIDARGVLRPADKSIKSTRRQAAPKLDEELAARSDLRRISLRQLDAQIRSHIDNGQPLPDELRLLAGMYRVEYVVFDKAARDVLIAGPAEGWVLAADGREIGKSSRRPILHLEDLAAALRCVLAGDGEASCSIDPTREGLEAVNRYQYTPTTSKEKAESQRQDVIERFGLQVVRTSGVPAGSRFALVMIEADYRMKRLAMGLEKASGLFTHLDSLVELTQQGQFNFSLLRWWFTPDYDPVLSSADGGIHKIRGQAVRLMNEEMAVAADGRRLGPAGAVGADKFSQSFTKQFRNLEASYAAFSDLRNLFDLMLVAAIVEQQKHSDWLSNHALLDERVYAIPKHEQPKRAEPAVMYKLHQKSDSGRRKAYITVAYGGVTINASQALKSSTMQTDASGELTTGLFPVSTRADIPKAKATQNEALGATAASAPRPVAGLEKNADVAATPAANQRWWEDIKP